MENTTIGGGKMPPFVPLDLIAYRTLNILRKKSNFIEWEFFKKYLSIFLTIYTNFNLIF